MCVPVLHLDLLSRHLQRVSLLGLCRLEVEVERGLALLPPPPPPLRPAAANGRRGRHDRPLLVCLLRVNSNSRIYIQ